VEEARQAAAAARADRASLELAVRREVKEAAVAAEQARTQVELYRERLVPLARETLQAALTAYPTGRTDLISVLDAQRALADLDVAGVRALHEYHRRIAALDRAGGVSHE
jgi:cobalt-zinc-cadmium efflux system outer membrane protein